VCANAAFTGCGAFLAEGTCNTNICKWVPPEKALYAAWERKVALAQVAVEEEDEGAAEKLTEVLGEEPLGHCAFDSAKGGRCKSVIDQSIISEFVGESSRAGGRCKAVNA